MDRLKETEKAEFGSIEEGESLLKSHERLKRDMSEAHVIVSEEGKNLLSALQKPSTDDRSAKARSRASDYSEAVSHVMDRILEMHERNRQLTISWEKQRVRLSQRCELSKFQNECNEVRSISHLLVVLCMYMYVWIDKTVCGIVTNLVHDPSSYCCSRKKG